MKHNYKYGKLINNQIEYAPYPLRIDGYDVYGATAEQHREQGYKPIIRTIAPEIDDNQYRIEIYGETENEILVNYRVENVNG